MGANLTPKEVLGRSYGPTVAGTGLLATGEIHYIVSPTVSQARAGLSRSVKAVGVDLEPFMF